MDDTQPSAEAMVTCGNTFAGTGSAAEMKARFPGARSVDLEGGVVLPGIIDGHAHPLSASKLSAIYNQTYPSAIADLLERIKAEAGTAAPDKWIYIHRIFPSRIDCRRFPTRKELDYAAPDTPVYLNGAFGAMLNSKALALSGLSDSSAHPGLIRDAGGRLTGAVLLSAQHLIKYSPGVEAGFDSEEYIAMLKRYARTGITSVCDVFYSADEVRFVSALAARRALPLRVNFAYSPNLGADTEDARAKIMSAPMKTGEGSDWFRAGPLKTYVDGGMLTATAYMSEPYGAPASEMFGGGDSGYRGITAYNSPEELAGIIRLALDASWRFTAHCTGDGAAALLLDVYSDIHREKPLVSRRCQIIHANFLSPHMQDQCAAMSILPDIQPAWLYRDADALLYWLGSRKMKNFQPWHSMLQKGIQLCAGSDHMSGTDPDTSVNPYNPWLGMYAFCSRQSDKGTRHGKTEALTREDAIRAYTVNNAYKSGEENRKGSITAGKLADFIVLASDPFTCGIDEVKEIRPVHTFIDGVMHL